MGRIALVATAAGLLLCLAVGLSFAVGSVPVPLADVWAALTTDGTEDNHLIVRELRGPRTLSGVLAGACLAVAGGLLQGATRNPLASPSLMGITAGAAFGVVLAVAVLNLPAAALVWAALIGGAGAATVALWLASTGKDGLSPLRLALSGAIVSLLLSSWTTALLATKVSSADIVRYWLAGSLAGRDISPLGSLIPVLVVGGVATVLVARPLNILSLGDSVAVSLGHHPARLRAIACVAAVCLAAAAVAMTGPIGFVGLAVPHFVKLLVGGDMPRVLAFSALFGPVLVLMADVLGRVISRPAEVEAGILTALVGAPVLVLIALRKRVAAA